MSLDPWQPLSAGEHPVFRTDHSLTLPADGPTPWGYLRVVPTVQPDERRVDWALDDTVVATLRMTDLDFGRRRLGKADHPVILDPGHDAELSVGAVTGSVRLVVEGRRRLRPRGKRAHLHVALGGHDWSTSVQKVWYQLHDGAEPAGAPLARVRDHAVQDAGRPSDDRTDDWRHAHLLAWSAGTPLAAVATAHLLRAGTNWEVVGPAMLQAGTDGARRRHFEERNHLLDEN